MGAGRESNDLELSTVYIFLCVTLPLPRSVSVSALQLHSLGQMHSLTKYDCPQQTLRCVGWPWDPTMRNCRAQRIPQTNWMYGWECNRRAHTCTGRAGPHQPVGGYWCAEDLLEVYRKWTCGNKENLPLPSPEHCKISAGVGVQHCKHSFPCFLVLSPKSYICVAQRLPFSTHKHTHTEIVTSAIDHSCRTAHTLDGFSFRDPWLSCQ